MTRMIDRQSPGRYAWLLIALSVCAGRRVRDVAVHREPAPRREFVSRDAHALNACEIADDDDVDLTDSIQLVSEETTTSPEASAENPESRASLSLAAILQLAESQNPNIALAQERIQEAYARVDRADALWLPSIRAGINDNHHEGRIQDVAGNIINTNRSSLYGGEQHEG